MPACSYLLALTEGRSSEEEAQVVAAWKRQADIETKAVEKAVQKWREGLETMRRAGAVERMPPANKMMLQWFEPLRDSIAAEQQRVSSPWRPS